MNLRGYSHRGIRRHIRHLLLLIQPPAFKKHQQRSARCNSPLPVLRARASKSVNQVARLDVLCPFGGVHRRSCQSRLLFLHAPLRPRPRSRSPVQQRRTGTNMNIERPTTFLEKRVVVGSGEIRRRKTENPKRQQECVFIG